jgi:hypothetical protein
LGVSSSNIETLFLCELLVNRAKRPERNLNGFGNVPWSDAGLHKTDTSNNHNTNYLIICIFLLLLDGATARQNDIKQITYGIQYSFQTTPYVNDSSQYSTTINRTGYLAIQLYLIFRENFQKD